MSRFTLALFCALGLAGYATAAEAQVEGPWRGVGPQPCYGVGGSVQPCPTPPEVIAIRAGQLFDSNTGRMLTNQVILSNGEHITDVGPAGKIKIPAGAQVINLSRATVMPGLIDAHTHMFFPPKPGMSREAADLLAVQHVQADLRAGFTVIRDMSTHNNGYDDVEIRDAINRGQIDGPRALVATRGIAWGDPAKADVPVNPLADAIVHNVDEARAAVRDQVQHGADWIKLFPTGAYSFTPNGDVNYVLTYPKPVLEALIDETHRLGKKAACHVLGGEGEHNAILLGCDTIEHAFALTQEEANMIVQKGLAYDPTLLRYSAPYMDDNDAKNTGGKYRMIPIIERAVRLADKTPGLRLMVGTGSDGEAYPHGEQGLEFQELVQHAGLTPAHAIQDATIVNADVLGLKDQLGSIDKGKYADIIAVSGDPLKDITEMQRVKFVMKGGKIIRNDLTQAGPR